MPTSSDLRLAIRGLRRSPGFALTATLTLALGIGLATAVFSVANAVLLRPLPIAEQDRIVVLWGQTRDGRFAHFPLTLAHAREFARRTASLERVAFAAYEGAWPRPIREGDRISSLRQALVSGDFFGVLGAQPVLGRALRPEDDVIGAERVVVLSHAAWQQRFGGDRDVLGRRVHVYDEDVVYTIVGVMPEGLDYPRGADFWAPVTPARSGPDGDAPNAHVDVIGRLASGATAERARAELTAFFARADAPAGAPRLVAAAHSLPRLVLGDTRPALFVFAAASVLLLLITCVNVANLLLVRGLARTREIAVRSALGASRRRIVRLLLTENALLAAVGGVLGIVVASVAVQIFLAFAPADLPRLAEIDLDRAALVAALVLTAAATLAFGVAPALVTAGVDVQQALRAGTRETSSRRSRWATEGLVAAQVALAVLVLSAAGVVARSLLELERAELSLDPGRLLIAELALRTGEYGDVDAQRRLLERLVPALEEIPGVRAASPVVAVPFSGSGGWDGRLAAEGQSPAEAAENPMLNMEVVAPGYFETLGIPILRGRGFTDADDAEAPAVVLLSESAARHFWSGADPIGQRIRGLGPDRSFTVVGIVPETRYRDLREPRLSVYFPLRQSFFPFAPRYIAIHSTLPSAEVATSVRRVIRETAPGVELANATPFERHLDEPLAQPRLNALLLAVFAGAAVTLAGVGLFGVMATMVRRRARELGVRAALGATAGDLRALVIRRGLAIAGIGIAAGLLGALAANRLLEALLYGVSPTDPVTLAIVAAFLLGVAMLASAIPARATTRIDPAAALKAQ